MFIVSRINHDDDEHVVSVECISEGPEVAGEVVDVGKKPNCCSDAT